MTFSMLVEPAELEAKPENIPVEIVMKIDIVVVSKGKEWWYILRLATIQNWLMLFCITARSVGWRYHKTGYCAQA